MPRTNLKAKRMPYVMVRSGLPGGWDWHVRGRCLQVPLAPAGLGCCARVGTLLAFGQRPGSLRRLLRFASL